MIIVRIIRCRITRTVSLQSYKYSVIVLIYNCNVSYYHHHHHQQQHCYHWSYLTQRSSAMKKCLNMSFSKQLLMWLSWNSSGFTYLWHRWIFCDQRWEPFSRPWVRCFHRTVTVDGCFDNGVLLEQSRDETKWMTEDTQMVVARWLFVKLSIWTLKQKMEKPILILTLHRCCFRWIVLTTRSLTARP